MREGEEEATGSIQQTKADLVCDGIHLSLYVKLMLDRTMHF
jgi:hypothetical protein